MIIEAKNFETLKEDLDLDKVDNMRFYYKKICAVSESTYEHQKIIKKDALKIKKIIESEYPEYLL